MKIETLWARMAEVRQALDDRNLSMEAAMVDLAMCRLAEKFGMDNSAVSQGRDLQDIENSIRAR